MKLKIFKADSVKANAKCSIHISGKLGFSQAAINWLKIDSTKYLLFATNEDDKKDTSLYMFVLGESREDALKVIKAGNYFYANTKKMFDEFGVDYRKKSVIYDIKEDVYEGQKMYVLLRREKDRKQ